MVILQPVSGCKQSCQKATLQDQIEASEKKISFVIVII
ncbi:hypothetical protein AS4_43190 [Acinetobacter guillouiae]|jgi:hypothetical protein|nr:hypothetical protein AS4_43190 [Acinetobacter guillouiae]